MAGLTPSNRARATWDYVRTSLWFLPALMVAAGAALAVFMLRVDAGAGGEDAVRAWWMNAGDGDDARNLLSTLLTATISMASMVFSVTVVALTLAANQYGPRLVRIFRANLRNQATLGCFAATIVYLLLVLRSVHAKAPLHEVPHAAVTVGTFLSLVCVLALLAFIQGVARSIVADEVVDRVAGDLDRIILPMPLLSEEAAPAHPSGGDLPAGFAERARRVALRRDGYVQAVDHADMVRWAERHDAVVTLNFRAGDHVVAGDTRLLVDTGGRPPDPRAEGELRDLVVIGRERTPIQDIEFPLRHLVEIAVRALSPGTNDPFTAVAVVDRLRGSLTRAMERRLPPEVYRGRDGRVRLVTQATTYEGIVDAAFNQIRQAGKSMPAVVIHMLEAIARIAERAPLAEQRAVLARHARMVAEAGLRESREPSDRADIERSWRRAREASGDDPDAPAGRDAAPPG